MNVTFSVTPATFVILVMTMSAQLTAATAKVDNSVTLLCNIQTIQHLNCGGGLTVPGAPLPDCKNFVSETVLSKQRKKVSVPSDRFRYDGNRIQVHYVSTDAVLYSDGPKITYETSPNLYTDAAGYSVDRGVCNISSGKNHIRRLKAPRK